MKTWEEIENEYSEKALNKETIQYLAGELLSTAGGDYELAQIVGYVTIKRAQAAYDLLMQQAQEVR